MIDTESLQQQAAAQGVPLTGEMLDRFDRYAALLVEWNEKMNLTAITKPEEIVRKHFVDSLTLLPLLPQGEFRLIDVGTGAGFPGVALAIACPRMRLTLLDSLNKRLLFLKTVCGELSIPAEFIHARAEEGGRKPELRERFDAAAARAVANLPLLCEYCLPFVRPGGVFYAMKGPDGEEERKAAEKAAEALGGRLGTVKRITILGGSGEESLDRLLIPVDKVSPTPPKYPRPSAKIAKQGPIRA